ncbi:MAG: SoxR reducing system RseC family protein [Christensenellaceae bacterium]|jgi:sigma-E factor negative regulatory protein RseC|nr:SoxR reducing system RseC family protein [Christensenellaceae bacterium]
MEESGRVLEIHGETMTVLFERSAMCERCGACEKANEEMRMLVGRAEEAEVGDRVKVSLRGGTLLKAALLAYGLPLAGLLLGLILGETLPFQGNRDLIAVGLGLGFAGLAFFGLKLSEPLREKRYTPTVVAIEKPCTRRKEA